MAEADVERCDEPAWLESPGGTRLSIRCDRLKGHQDYQHDPQARFHWQSFVVAVNGIHYPNEVSWE